MTNRNLKDGGRRSISSYGRKSRSGIATLLIVGIIVAVVVVAGGTAAYLFYYNPSTSGGIGTSTISLAQSSGSVAAGKSMTVGYTVSLASGQKWGTSVVVANSQTITSNGITVSPSVGAMDPNYSGNLTISVSPSTSPGTYQISLKATGDDPSTSNAVFTLTVTPCSGTCSASTTTTTSSTTSTPYGGGYPIISLR
jgi:hypothetical protein